MHYEGIHKAVFLSRPNRFIAQVELDGQKETVHVKNTGRCKELLIPGATVFIQEQNRPSRKTRFDLISVLKNGCVINMDSQAVNQVAEEFIRDGNLFNNVRMLRREKTYKDSRFDLYLETDTDKIFVEVKGVTLEIDSMARFPDAPTLRGLKHIHELCDCVDNGYKACILFVIQMKGISSFSPNDETQPEFRAALKQAEAKGVMVKAFDCLVTEDILVMDKEIPVLL